MAGNYTAKNIGVLEFPDNVRKRPGMFLGSDGQSGAQHAAKEIVDNSIDEHLAGHGKIITVVFDTKTGFLTCVDQGRGVPVDFHEKTQESALTTVFTKLNAGGKFDSESYDKAAGLHGVGAACTNAVAESFEVWSYRSEGGRKAPAWHYQKFERGLATTAVIKQNPPGTLAAQKVGTIVRFKLDAQIFHEHQIDPVQLLEFGRDAAALNPGLEMRYIVDGRKFRFFAETGLSSMVTGVKTESPVLGKDFRLYRPGEIDVAICWYDDHEESIRSYVNGSHTTHGGKHVDGFRAALVRALREQSGKDFEAKYWVKGMRAALNWRMNDPVYHGQTKGELASDVENVVRDAVYPHLALWLKQNANLVKALTSRAAAFKTNEDRFKADNKAIKAIKLVDPNARGVLPGKLEQAHGYSPDERELFIVEGDSASGTVKKARLPWQEVLPLRGKIPNPAKTDFSKLMENEEIQAIFQSIGCLPGDEYNVKSRRVARVMIMTDADPDGKHICALLLCLFGMYLKPWLSAMHINYIESPLFYGSIRGDDKKYGFDVNSVLDQFDAKHREKVLISRLKGHGEANAQDVFKYAMNPVSRKITQFTFDGTPDLDHIHRVMGDDVTYRKQILGLKESN